ncbi:MAG: Metal-binding protein [Candidatus Rokubacteria bacterium]|nr:Metal-binding protein [Candidatus Rokubacteria bacterium]
MSYERPGCAYCPPTVRACRHGESETRGPGFCPSKVDEEGIERAWERYEDPEVRRVAYASALVESEGYCRWTRVEEICAFARKMGFTRIGIATCISMVDLARTLSGILESHGFEVASAACKNGGVPKERLGLRDEDKIRPGTYEAMCNPLSQAELLNDAGCELNIVLGLCVGHDSLFFKHSKGLATTLVAKDRVLAHNPVGALQLADTYFQRVWGPLRPTEAPKLPAEGRD